MSKLLIAIVHHDDAGPAAEALRAAGHRFTQLPSIGGFLGTDNATFLFGVEDTAEPGIIGIFEHVCHRREIEIPLVLTERLAEWQARTVSHGGATIFVADLDRIVRI
ncbi:MAG: cyclic-di-AMP receptor [Candidatus Limnocylindrales bacterium]